MGGIAEVISIDRSAEPAEIKVDAEDPRTPEHYQPAGDDALPLAGDFAAVEGDDEGSSSGQVVGYHDPIDANRKASPGEKRIYARSPEGVLVAEVWLKNDGTLALKSVLATSGGSIDIQPSGNVVINGVTFDPEGNISTPGDIEAGGDIDAEGTIAAPEVAIAGLAHSTHTHNSAAPGSPGGPPIAPPPPP
jgi:hypothetical protein